MAHSRFRLVVEDADGVLPMITCYRIEFVQDLLFLALLALR